MARSEGSVPAAAATTAVYNIAEQPTTVYSSSSSDTESIASTTTREARLASALAKQATAQREYELAKANQEVAEAQEEALAQPHAASIAMIGDVQGGGGNSARAQQGSSTEMAVPPLPLEKVAEVRAFQGAPAQDK